MSLALLSGSNRRLASLNVVIVFIYLLPYSSGDWEILRYLTFEQSTWSWTTPTEALVTGLGPAKVLTSDDRQGMQIVLSTMASAHLASAPSRRVVGRRDRA